jgi:hypothetical protein
MKRQNGSGKKCEKTGQMSRKGNKKRRKMKGKHRNRTEQKRDICRKSISTQKGTKEAMLEREIIGRIRTCGLKRSENK